MSEQPAPPVPANTTPSSASSLRGTSASAPAPAATSSSASQSSATPSSPQPPSTPIVHKSSIADILSTPPPIHPELSTKQSTGSLNRRLSTSSSISTDESGSSLPGAPGSGGSGGSTAAGHPGTAGSTSSNILASPSTATSAVSFVTSTWQDVQMNELVQRENLVYVDGDTTVESAFETLDQHKFTSLPIKAYPEDPSVSDTFDYADLNAYLLMVMGLIEPDNDSQEFKEDVKKARSGQVVPVRFAAHLGAKNELISLKSTDTIAAAVEILGAGVHRIAIADVTDPRIVVGILSQRRLIRFIWENGRRFKTLEPLFQTSLADLGIGPKKVVSINGDKPVIDAFLIMHENGVSSMAVTDHNNNLLGNISIVDVRLITKSSQKHLLRTPCKHFLSIILNERGLHDGQDSYPVFHVTLNSSVGRTIAKLVATKAHRLWIVQPPQHHHKTSIDASPSSASSSTAQPPSSPTPNAHAKLASPAIPGPTPGSSHLGNPSTTAGQLIGVISLTDIINILAKQAGKGDVDPHAARRQRRRSSSSSSRSYEKFRRSISVDRASDRASAR